MKFSGHEDKCLRLINAIQSLCKRNYYFSNLWSIVEKSNLEVVVLGEKELLEDSHNREKTITEFWGYYLSGVIYLFQTRYDVDDSLLSRFLHELCHALLLSNPMSFLVIDVMDKSFYATVGDIFDISKAIPNSYDIERTSKLTDVHDMVPGEEIANRFAELLVGKRYDWVWKMWRIQEVDGN